MIQPKKTDERFSGDNRQLRRFLFSRKAVRCAGERIVFVDAPSRLEAEALLARTGGAPYNDTTEISELSQLQFSRETDVGDYGPNGHGHYVPTPADIGSFADSVPGAWKNGNRVRDVDDLAARALDEMVELALACGMQPGEIFASIADSLHNQALKHSRLVGTTVFPSEIGQMADRSEIASELAGTHAVLKDLAFVAGVNVPAAEAAHWRQLNELPASSFYADRRGTMRQHKAHVIASKPGRAAQAEKAIAS